MKRTDNTKALAAKSPAELKTELGALLKEQFGLRMQRATQQLTNTEKLKQVRPYVIVGAFIVAAIFTPPDVVSQLLLAIPLVVLYELGIVLARFVEKPKPADESSPQEVS